MVKNTIKKKNLSKEKEGVWQLSKDIQAGMNVPARIIASDKLLADIENDRSLDQLANTATLPGVEQRVYGMPDMHEGYGAPIGGVIPINPDKGIISPGAIGFDINCGVRLLATQLQAEKVEEKKTELINKLFSKIPSSVGSTGPLSLNKKELSSVLEKGVDWCLKNGYGVEKDKENCEEGGKLKAARADALSKKAKKRGQDQLGTLGSGNHFLELQKVDEIFNEDKAEEFDIKKGQVMVMIHCGSRGLGHQVCTDFTKKAKSEFPEYNGKLPDPELAGAPFSSELGKDYFSAMSASANFAWANRQVITSWTREVWQDVFKEKGGGELKLVWDVAHNMAKLEKHQTNEGKKELLVHRKGAVAAFLNQPVIVPGSMGSASYLMMGGGSSEKLTVSSTAHGAGRLMSRGQAKKEVWGQDLKKELQKKGIEIKARSMPGLAEEAPAAYKNIEDVVGVMDRLDISNKVARFKPIGVIKG